MSLGAGMTLGSGLLASPFGLPAGLVQGAGLVLLPIGLFIGWLATRSFVPAALVWLVTVSRYELSSLYPFLAVNFLLVPICAVWLFGESVNPTKLIGLSLVIVGLVIFARGV